jgi:hypothetical protein
LISLDVYAGGRNFRGVFDVLFDIWIEFVVWNFSSLNCCSKINLKPKFSLLPALHIFPKLNPQNEILIGLSIPPKFFYRFGSLFLSCRFLLKTLSGTFCWVLKKI